MDKSNYVIFSSSQRQIHYSIKIFINEVELKERKSIKYLGVIIDKNLKWNDHIHELSKKIAKSIAILSKFRHFVQKSTLIQLYYSIIYPFLIYGVTVWGNTYQSLITLQKKAVRIINFSSFNEHSSPLFKGLHLLKFTDIVYYNTALFMHNFLMETFQIALTDFLIQYVNFTVTILD